MTTEIEKTSGEKFVRSATRLLLFVGLFLSTLIGQYVLAVKLATLPSNAIYSIGFVIVSFLIVTFIATRKYNLSHSLRKPTIIEVWRSVRLGVFLLLGIQVVTALMEWVGILSERSSRTAQHITESMQTPSLTLGLVLITTIVAPFCEELVFRSTIPQLLDTKKEWILTLTQATLFSLAHFQGLSTSTDFLVLIWTFIGALFLRREYVKSETLWTPFIVHSVYNLIPILITVFLLP